MTSTRPYISQAPLLNPPNLPPSDSNNNNSSGPRRIYQILAGQLFDPVARALVPNQVITVDRDAGVILDVSPQALAKTPEEVLAAISKSIGGDSSSAGVGVGANKKPEARREVEVTRINMSGMTVLPGLVDVHVHFFLHPYSETPWEDQVTKESLAERTVRATVHARKTLLAGFTTVRDLGTEGAFDADIGLRKCLAGRNALIPGPRYYCVTRAIISTGSYGPKSSLYPAQEGIDGVKGAEPVDGVNDCVREVRKQIGAGADWIKIYADYSCRSRMAEVSSSLGPQQIATFNKEELWAMISAAHARGVKVCAHANTWGAIDNLLDLGVDSIEHGSELYDKPAGDNTLLRKFTKANGTTTWVPTLAAYYTIFVTSRGGSEYARRRWETCKATFEEALKARMENIACGGDTGVFAHGENALELVLMRRLGASWDRVLSWATYGGWKCVRGMEWEGVQGERRLVEIEKGGYAALVEAGFRVEQENGLERGVPFGVVRAGWAADLVGFEGKLDGSGKEFEDTLMKGVKFVMKGGKIYKRDGQEVVGI
ncbi:hypothetical protein BDZ97DRAFT_1913765 [Flammula alnicola]|nr:hypothetical protein BDZ97DRAFT_1913765 [Flammula alnicola]